MKTSGGELPSIFVSMLRAPTFTSELNLNATGQVVLPHNILEPLACGRPALFGPNLANFQDIRATALDAGVGLEGVELAAGAFERDAHEADVAREDGHVAALVAQLARELPDVLLQPLALVSDGQAGALAVLLDQAPHQALADEARVPGDEDGPAKRSHRHRQ